MQTNENDRADKQKRLYVPVSMALSTETENHDIFRHILEELFMTIIKPTPV